MGRGRGRYMRLNTKGDIVFKGQMRKSGEREVSRARPNFFEIDSETFLENICFETDSKTFFGAHFLCDRF